MTKEQIEAAFLYETLITTAAKISFYSDETIMELCKLVDQRLFNKDKSVVANFIKEARTLDG